MDAAARLEKSLLAIRCQANAVAYYGVNLAARLGAISLRAAGHMGLSDDGLLSSLLAEGVYHKDNSI